MKLALLCAGTLVSGVAHAGPAWCTDANQMEQGSLDDKQDPDRQLLAAAYLKCHPSEVVNMAKVDAAIQALTTMLSLTDADWGDVGDFARSHGNKDIRLKDEQAPWSTRDAIEQYATFQHPVLSVPSTAGEIDRWDLADIFGPKLSQAGRLELVRQCIKSGKPAEWVMCQGDIDALDFAKLDAELRADKTHAGAAHIAVRFAALELKPELKKHADDVAKLQAKDPAWRTLFGLAAQERKDWDARYRDKPDLVAVAAAMDDAIVTGSRKASAGCKDKTWEQLAKAIRALPAKSFVTHRQKDEEEVLYGDDAIETTLSTIIGDPDAFLAANAYMLCHIAERTSDIVAINLQPRISRWAGFRGPRTSTMTRMILSAPELDDRNDKIDYPDLQRFWIHDAREAGQIIGMVSSVVMKGDKATVSYAQKLVKVTYDTGCTNGRLHSIRSDGSLEYELNCTGSKTETVDRRPPPEDIEARYAKELKPGMQSLIRKHALFIAWPKEGATIPVLVLGQPVK